MDVHKHSRRVERLEIVETGRQRRWSEDEKLKIVMESYQSSRQIAATARRHGISRSLLHEWRRALPAARTEAAGAIAGFVPATLAAEPQPAAPARAERTQRPQGETAAPPDPGPIEIEIDFANGARMKITGAIDRATLAATLEALSGGRGGR
jgi:transposase